jgi:arabinogalactan endo-1,4-beta-galactosidase
VLVSCHKDKTQESIFKIDAADSISGVDISRFPEISITNPSFYDQEGIKKDFLVILKENGVNTIRLRLWVNPANQHSGFNEVKSFSETLKSLGFKTWLTLHYSDTWADPGQQEVPNQWKGLSFETLKDSVSQYTQRVVLEMKPDYIQIGNEINSGFLHPYGNNLTNFQQFYELLQTGISAVRNNSEDCKVIIHFAGIENSNLFFSQLIRLDYDIIGLSYYPLWHGKSLSNLKNTMQILSENYNRKILIAETAYPFTLGWNDLTNNIVGLNEQLILPDYQASSEGQAKFIKQIKSIATDVKGGIGFCYWGAELVSWKGTMLNDASPWENQALFDFQNKALPVLKEFRGY